LRILTNFIMDVNVRTLQAGCMAVKFGIRVTPACSKSQWRCFTNIFHTPGHTF